MAERPQSRATIFGAPIGELGLFTTILFGGVLGFAAFFVATFIGIITILLYNSSGHAPMNFAYSYLRFGMPVGVGVAMVVWAYLGRLWVARITAHK